MTQPTMSEVPPSDYQTCSYCDQTFPAPVELHHHESDCALLPGHEGEHRSVFELETNENEVPK